MSFLNFPFSALLNKLKQSLRINRWLKLKLKLKLSLRKEKIRMHNSKGDHLINRTKSHKKQTRKRAKLKLRQRLKHRSRLRSKRMRRMKWRSIRKCLRLKHGLRMKIKWSSRPKTRSKYPKKDKQRRNDKREADQRRAKQIKSHQTTHAKEKCRMVKHKSILHMFPLMNRKVKVEKRLRWMLRSRLRSRDEKPEAGKKTKNILCRQREQERQKLVYFAYVEVYVEGEAEAKR